MIHRPYCKRKLSIWILRLSSSWPSTAKNFKFCICNEWKFLRPALFQVELNWDLIVEPQYILYGPEFHLFTFCLLRFLWLSDCFWSWILRWSCNILADGRHLIIIFKTEYQSSKKISFFQKVSKDLLVEWIIEELADIFLVGLAIKELIEVSVLFWINT